MREIVWPLGEVDVLRAEPQPRDAGTGHHGDDGDTHRLCRSARQQVLEHVDREVRADGSSSPEPRKPPQIIM